MAFWQRMLGGSPRSQGKPPPTNSLLSGHVPGSSLSGLSEVATSQALRTLYLTSVLHGFSDACAKLATPGFVYEYEPGL